MKKIYILLAVIALSAHAFSQDLIVTDEGDSINCKISKVQPGNIYFTFMHQDEARSTLLPFTKVKYYEFRYYRQGEVSKDKIVGYAGYQRLRIAINGGYSYNPAKVNKNVQPDFKDYVKELRSGYHYGGDITYFFEEQMGFGFKYYLFKSNNSLDNIYVEDMEGERRYGKMKDDIKVSFIGPSFSGRFLNRDKSNALILSAALGYMGYTDNKLIVDPYKMTGSTLGTALDIGYDIGLSKNTSIGFQLSLISGYLAEYRWDDGITKETIELEEGDYESLYRIDFSVGLRFGK
jgi:hypothetical protein